ncbi:MULTISPECIES: zinc-binding dehydrogenase [unclassified Citrobacter]|uniref:quinone oxidoreductase family protein n=1 Tax=unclassified Citrobacter TaxID=2644389 RepID=UPI0023026C5C|nr:MULTISPECIES: zinc-binding dehydrogenase [unclassified Citrobacter]MDA8514192.1 zinc-binding dehydrogenase [Citrobacter sp. Igbk 14]MDA8517768.1 zinc-binding dehydrogenase [Citrobacter sp. Igbk 16]
MRAALVTAEGKAPVLGGLGIPVAAGNEQLIRVKAAAISNVVRARAAGTHYSSDNLFPFVAGVDGVGSLSNGQRVYFALPRPPHGSMADMTVTDPSLCVQVPDEVDDITAAAIVNPGMSSWMALTERAALKVGETVLINGATGTSGRLAVQIARYLGAGRIIATGRNASALREVEMLGADVIILLDENASTHEFKLMQAFHDGIDIVIDYLWGPIAEFLLMAAARAGREATPVRFVQVGSVSAPDITLPGSVLRSSAIHIMGSGHGSVPMPRLMDIASDVLRATIPAGLQIAYSPVPFSDFERAWGCDDSRCRTVFIMDAGGAGDGY